MHSSIRALDFCYLRLDRSSQAKIDYPGSTVARFEVNPNESLGS